MSAEAVVERLVDIYHQIGADGTYMLTSAEVQRMVSQLREALGGLQVRVSPRPDEPLLSARVGKMKDNKDVKPADLCRTMAHDLDTGFLKADGLVLVYMHRPEEGDWDCGRYLANMRSDQELVALELAKQACMDRWRRG